MADFSELLGKTLVAIEGAHKGSEAITFRCSDGTAYLMHHHQDCCEHVEVEDVVGNVAFIVGSQIKFAEDKSREAGDEEVSESGTWTFYTLGTERGWLDLRWLGHSNGYYSERVSFDRLDA
jgi:hypothetical protein